MAMRLVRNTCSSFMTRDQSEISIWRQLRWWYTLPCSTRPYVVEDDGDIIGYGLLVVDHPHGLLTGGLLPEVRGCGLGTDLFRYLAEEAEALGLVPWLEVRESNAAGRRVYEKLGFVEVGRMHGVIEMERATSR